ncbi:aldehyde dehydrogenase family protein [Rhodococcus sp. IEGM 1379]|uniref:aldehyde dehydrogenase family protein n=1 Tax=Rhodococcus sp. IEGM 1379 TaxID=3047086 RepID=UPI0024B6B0C2|nr:aldehyde dehydrogenase family protein [Rhodococcus sp. IEGM 1379]MDI9918146.1 aldehyde dehydrogenase family protein [Rhodococcus sp. IEGM 1379]
MDIEVPERAHFIDGTWLLAQGNGIALTDPSTEDAFFTVARGDASVVDQAVASARGAASGWAAKSASERGAILAEWGRALRENAESLAALEARDVGKPMWGGSMNIAIATSIIDYFAGAADKLTGATLPTRTPDFHGYTLLQPLGVCAVITPWNVPAVLTAANVAPALAAGNTVVLKPSEEAPRVVLALAALAARVGLPPGVFNVVTGLADAGAALTTHPDVNHISFVGSTVTGRAVMRAAAESLVPVKLELGGKSPNIVFADANLDVALPAIVASITENAGQNCYAGSRLMVSSEIVSEVRERVVDLMRAVRVGAWDTDVDMGPLVNLAQYERVLGFLDGAPAEGGNILTGGGRPAGTGNTGWFVEPTVIDNAEASSRIIREEIFGPVLAIQTFSSDAEALSIADDTDFGLLASIWTNDVSRALRMAAQVRTGQVSVNQFADSGVIGFPFNMTKDSGFSGGGGYLAMREYTQEKGVAIRLL